MKTQIPKSNTVRLKECWVRGLCLLMWMSIHLGSAGQLMAEETWAPPFYLETEKPDGQGTGRVAMLGPFLEQSYEEPKTWAAFRPLSVDIENTSKGEKESHFLYPFYNRYDKPHYHAWDMLGVVRYSQTKLDDDARVTHFMIFPIYYSKETGDKSSSYKGLFPVAGGVKGFFGYKEVSWFWFPLYARFDRWGESRVCSPWPFVQRLEGPDCSGGALWPLMGQFKRKNKYNRQYMLWPLIYDYKEDLDKPNITHKQGFLPFYTKETSANVESMTWVWPFFGYTHRTNPFYNESRYFWPFFVQGRGAVDYVNRWAPFYTHSIHRGKEKKWVMWPFLRTRNWDEKGVHIEEGQVFYFLIWSQRQWSLANPSAPFAEKTLIWPFFSYWDNGSGRKQFQFINPLEVFFLGNEVVSKVYTPLFALYRYNQIEPGHVRQTLLFNTVVWEKKHDERRIAIGPIIDWKEGKDSSHVQFLYGLFGLTKKNGKQGFKLFWKEFGTGGDS